MPKGSYIAHTTRQAKLLEQLEALSARVRDRLEGCWASDTAFPGITLTAETPPSAGQCYVSSMKLAWELSDLLPSALVHIARGAVTIGDNGGVSDHGWVCVQHDSSQFIIDITIDQIQRFDLPKSFILQGYQGDYQGNQLRYIEKERRQLSEITNFDTIVRYFILSSRYRTAIHGRY